MMDRPLTAPSQTSSNFSDSFRHALPRADPPQHRGECFADDLSSASVSPAAHTTTTEGGTTDSSGLTSDRFLSSAVGSFETRDRWSSRSAFIFAAIASAIGIGNLWRFPYLCFKYGGGAFFIPYIFGLLAVGIPILQLEFSLGQFFQGGHGVAFNGLTKRARGLGCAAPFACFVVVVYYCVILAWSLVYMVYSFQPNLPWTVHASDAKLCPAIFERNLCEEMEICAWSAVGKMCQPSVLKKAESFFNQVIGLAASPSDNISLSGSLYIVLGMMATWVLIFFAIFKGAKILGKIVYVTMALPVVLLLIVTVRAASLPGAFLGIQQYILKWDASVLVKRPTVWSDAVGQIFFSLGVCYGVMTAYASFNRKKQNVIQDAIIVATSNSLFSVISGFAVFSVAGFLATESATELAELRNAGVGLAFWTFPTTLAQLGIPAGQLFSVIFFLMFFLLGIDSAFSMVESAATFILDSHRLRKVAKVKVILPLCLTGFIVGLLFCANIGIHFVDAVDYYLANISAISIGFCECLFAGWIQGIATQASHVGWPAVSLFGVSYIGGAVLGISVGFGIRSTFSWSFSQPAGVLLGPLFGVTFGAVGTAMSLFLMDKTKRRSKRNGESFKGQVWWLLLGNIETLRQEMNIVVGAERKLCCVVCPKPVSTLTIPWSIMIKYAIPVILLTLLGQTLSSSEFGRYGGLPPKYQITGLVLACIPVLLIVIGVMLPMTFRAFVERPTSEACDSVSCHDNPQKMSAAEFSTVISSSHSHAGSVAA